MLVYSSFVFLTNVFHALLKQKMLYGLAFFVLFITSVLFRTVPEHYVDTAKKIDISAVFVVVSIGFFYFLRLLPSQQLLPAFFFLVISYFFALGYYTESFCWDCNKDIGNLYHSYVHLLSSLGHHAILYWL